MLHDTSFFLIFHRAASSHFRVGFKIIFALAYGKKSKMMTISEMIFLKILPLGALHAKVARLLA